MNCARARSLMMAYLDSELDARSTIEIGEHLRVCPGCARRFAAEERLERGLAAQLRGEACPPDVAQRLLAALEARPPAPRRRLPWVAAVTAVAAAAVLLVVLLVRGSGSEAGDDLLGELAEADAVSSSAPLDFAATDPGDISAYLGSEGLPLPGLPLERLPDSGVGGEHRFEWLGVRHVAMSGRTAAVVVGRCCGEAVSVFVMRRDDDGAAWPAAGRQRTRHGVTVTAVSSGPLDIAVVSRHPSPLASMLSTV